jgi:thiol-disulfide isomerase/thioredoxin
MNGIPNMKKYQKEYKDKIQFVSIACRDDSSRWAKTITDNNLDWIQVFNDGKGKNDLSKIYGIEGYPTKIIIDPDGKIVQSFLGETVDFYKKLDELFAKKG